MYFYKLAIALDQFFNALISGKPNETLSSRAYRCANLTDNAKKRWIIAEKVINAIFFWQKKHCYLAYVSQRKRNRL
ncbi:hypothetical protein RHO12_12600 (plasmid) [Orbus sturtevantii]|uniref:DNA helicase UvrD n=1 Tax=Orbus sturtevantii TaxID=3074109 RepID=UPI00370DAA49